MGRLSRRPAGLGFGGHAWGWLVASSEPRTKPAANEEGCTFARQAIWVTLKIQRQVVETMETTVLVAASNETESFGLKIVDGGSVVGYVCVKESA